MIGTTLSSTGEIAREVCSADHLDLLEASVAKSAARKRGERSLGGLTIHLNH